MTHIFEKLLVSGRFGCSFFNVFLGGGGGGGGGGRGLSMV